MNLGNGEKIRYFRKQRLKNGNHEKNRIQTLSDSISNVYKMGQSSETERIINKRNDIDHDLCDGANVNIRYVDNVGFMDQSGNKINNLRVGHKDRIRYFVSLSTIPDRFFDPEFLNVLEHLSEQTVRPTKIIVSY